MSDQERIPPRLVDGPADPMARSLLEYARTEQPHEDRAKAWLAAAPAAGGAAAVARRVSLAKAAIAVGVACVGAAAVGVAVMHRAHSSAPAPVASVEQPLPPASAPPPVLPEPAAPPTAAVALSTAPAVPDPSPAPSAASRAAAPSPSSSAPSLEAELARLRSARAQLAAGDASGAVASISRYERDFPRGALRPEAEAIAIDALVAAGRNAEAAARARRFLDAYGSSPQAERMRALVERLSP